MWLRAEPRQETSTPPPLDPGIFHLSLFVSNHSRAEGKKMITRYLKKDLFLLFFFFPLWYTLCLCVSNSSTKV